MNLIPEPWRIASRVLADGSAYDTGKLAERVGYFESAKRVLV